MQEMQLFEDQKVFLQKFQQFGKFLHMLRK
jgi:hypothetical protein